VSGPVVVLAAAPYAGAWWASEIGWGAAAAAAAAAAAVALGGVHMCGALADLVEVWEGEGMGTLLVL